MAQCRLTGQRSPSYAAEVGGTTSRASDQHVLLFRPLLSTMAPRLRWIASPASFESEVEELCVGEGVTHACKAAVRRRQNEFRLHRRLMHLEGMYNEADELLLHSSQIGEATHTHWHAAFA